MKILGSITPAGYIPPKDWPKPGELFKVLDCEFNTDTQLYDVILESESRMPLESPEKPVQEFK